VKPAVDQLGFSVFTSRILAMDLSQSHFKSHMNCSCHSLVPFLPLFCSCQFQRLDSVQFHFHIQGGGVSELDSTTVLYYACFVLLKRPSLFLYNLLTRTPRKTPCTVKKALPSNGCRTVACVAGMCLLSRCLAMRISHNIFVATLHPQVGDAPCRGDKRST
jgi:hypothetical protein